MLRHGAVAAHAKPTNVGMAALAVVRNCVAGITSTGGFTKELVSLSGPQFLWNSTSDVQAADHGRSGGDNNLVLAASKFTPNVVCSGSISGGSGILDSCQGMVDVMFVGRNSYTYVPKGSKGFEKPWSAEIGLPFIGKAPDQGSRTLPSLTLLLS